MRLTTALIEAYHITAYVLSLSYFLYDCDIVHLNSKKLTKELSIYRDIAAMAEKLVDPSRPSIAIAQGAPGTMLGCQKSLFMPGTGIVRPFHSVVPVVN